jgi:hypothetical protein
LKNILKITIKEICQIRKKFPKKIRKIRKISFFGNYPIRKEFPKKDILTKSEKIRKKLMKKIPF